MAQNYEEMKILYERHSQNGLEILAFPCNNFYAQEPGTNTEIQAFAKAQGATFPVLGKVDCNNGKQTHPLYVYLTRALNFLPMGRSVKWNYAKFLCNEDGKVVSRYFPTTSPLGIEKDILKLLKH
jgi:glutathione peroxidase